MDADKARKQNAKRNSALWFREEAGRLLTLSKGKPDDEANAKVEGYMKKANDILDKSRAEDAAIEEIEWEKTAQFLKRSRIEYEGKFKHHATPKDEKWRHICREQNLNRRGKGAQAEAEKGRDKHKELKEAKARGSQITPEPIHATPKPAPVARPIAPVIQPQAPVIQPQAPMIQPQTPITQSPAPVIEQPAPVPQLAPAPREDLGLFGMGNDIFELLAAAFTPTLSRSTYARDVLPHPSAKQIESVRKAEPIPASLKDNQDELGLFGDDGLDDLFDDNGIDDCKAAAEDVNDKAATKMQLESATEHASESQDEEEVYESVKDNIENKNRKAEDQDEGVDEPQNSAINALKRLIAESWMLHDT